MLVSFIKEGTIVISTFYFCFFCVEGILVIISFYIELCERISLAVNSDFVSDAIFDINSVVCSGGLYVIFSVFFLSK